MRKGFTLVEMLIVIVIIGILATALIPRLQSAQGKARDVARMANIKDISTAIELYAAENNGTYPLAHFYTAHTTDHLLATNSYNTNTTTYTNIIQNHLWNIPSVFAQSLSGSSVDMLASTLSPYIKDIPKDPAKKGIKITSEAGTCEAGGEYFAYYTDYQGTMFAITTINESKKGNTSNCKGIVDKKVGGYQVVGQGLTEYTVMYDPEIDGDPDQRCKNNLTQQEADELNTTFSGSKTIDQRCMVGESTTDWSRRSIFRRHKGLSMVPKGLSKLIGLIFIRLEHNNINKIYLPTTMPYLQQFYINGNPITSLTMPRNIPGPLLLGISSLKLSTLPELSIYPSISYMDVSGNSSYLKHLSKSNCSYIAPKYNRWDIYNFSTLCPGY